MPSSKQKKSQKTIELEIYKTFEKYKQCKNIKIADFLKSFYITSLFNLPKYRKIKFPYEALVKLIIYQQLKGIKFHTKLTKYLKRNPFDKFKLGFTNTPDRRTIGYFINHILDQQTKELINYTVSKIIEISEKFGILIDLKTLEPDKPLKDTKERNRYIITDKKTREICKIVKNRIIPFINLHIGKNAVYKKVTFIDLLIHLGLNQNFAETGSRIYKEYKKICPNADTFLYHLKKYSDINEIQRMYETLFEIIWNITKQTNVFNLRKKVDVAIDFTDWLFYGDRKTRMVLGTMPKDGTDKCYKFITINIVDSGKRFTMLALPVSNLSTKEELLTKLIFFVKQRVKINCIYLDRGFYDSKTIQVLNNSNLKWLMPVPMNALIKKIMETSPAPTIITDFTMINTRFNLAIGYDEKGEKRAFATNEQYTDSDVNFINRLFIRYDKRWGIETSYRVKKHSFRAKTTSKNYHIRLFYFLFSVLMYNLWILADMLVWFYLYSFIGEDHKVASKYFGTIFISIDPGG
jgi:putative transposase